MGSRSCEEGIGDPLGELRWRDVRDVWKHEAGNFTPWLRNNLHHVADALGLELDLVEREAPVGDFSCDLVAKDLNSGRWVIIENQLAPTDHSHLGQLLTYAANRKAGVVVWISPEFRDEHREAIEWLNSMTSEELDFFGLQLEVMQINDSPMAVNLHVAVKPNYWRKGVIKPPPTTPRQTAYNAFFSEVLAELKAKAPGMTSANKVGYGSWFAFSAGRSGCVFSFAFTQDKRFRVELYIDRGDAVLNEQTFDLLQNQAEGIEAEMGAPLNWDRLEGKRACRISYYGADAEITDSPEKLAEVGAWAVQTMIEFRNVLAPRLMKLP